MKKNDYVDYLDLYSNEKLDIFELEEIIKEIVVKYDFNIIHNYALKLNKHYDKKNLCNDDLYLILEYLSNKKFLMKKFDIIIRACPICHSNISILKCHNCGGINIEELKKIIHICGHVDKVISYISKNDLNCPICGDQLIPGSDDYRYSATVYKCIDCGITVNKYNNLDDEIICEKCGAVYRKDQTEIINFYKIKIT